MNNLDETTKDPEFPKQSWEKKNKTWGIIFHDFRPSYKATVIKIAWTDTKTDTQINGTE